EPSWMWSRRTVFTMHGRSAPSMPVVVARYTSPIPPRATSLSKRSRPKTRGRGSPCPEEKPAAGSLEGAASLMHRTLPYLCKFGQVSGEIATWPIRCREGGMKGRWRRLLFGPPRDVDDPHAFHKVSLAALLAWVGLGADGLSSSAYGPDEA